MYIVLPREYWVTFYEQHQHFTGHTSLYSIKVATLLVLLVFGFNKIKSDLFIKKTHCLSLILNTKVLLYSLWVFCYQVLDSFLVKLWKLPDFYSASSRSTRKCWNLVIFKVWPESWAIAHIFLSALPWFKKCIFWKNSLSPFRGPWGQ